MTADAASQRGASSVFKSAAVRAPPDPTCLRPPFTPLSTLCNDVSYCGHPFGAQGLSSAGRYLVQYGLVGASFMTVLTHTHSSCLFRSVLHQEEHASPLTEETRSSCRY